MPTTSAATRATLLLAAALLCCSSQVAGFAVQHQRIGRRRALEYAAAAAAVGTTTASPQPARAEPSKDAEYYEEDVKNDSSLGDPALYTPSVRIDAAGSTNSKLSVVMPKAGGPRTVNDFVDCMWFTEVESGKIVAAESFGANGLSRDFSMREDSGNEPSFAARIKSGMTVVPMIHAKKGGTWKGAAFTAK